MQPPTHYPQEYIDGYTTFFGKRVRVTPDTLIPRLETECLVRRARSYLQHEPHTAVIDVGTGSGIIALSTADLAEYTLGIDISAAALSVAQENFFTHFPDTPAHFFESNLLDTWDSWKNFTQKAHTLLFLANLPYIKQDDWEHMSEDTRYEPPTALFGGKQTGFELYETLLQSLDQISQTTHQKIACIGEFGFDQRDIAQEVLSKYPRWSSEFFPDYAGRERFFFVQIPPLHEDPRSQEA